MDGKRSIPPRRIGPVIFIAIQIGGFALLWGKDTPPPEYVYLPATADKTATGTAPVSAPVVVVSPPDEKALRQIIQTVLEQELVPYARQLAAAPGVAQGITTANPPDVKENSPENIQAINEATNAVSASIAQGAWTDEANMRVLGAAKYLTEQQRTKIMEDIINAINRKEMKLEGAVPAL